MTFLELRPVGAIPGLWLHPDAGSAPLPEAGPRTSASGRGRGEILRVALGSCRAIVKTHRRGGLLGGLLPDAFVSAARAVAEARALERLAPLGVAPRCLGLQVRGAALRRLTVAVEEVPGALDLLEHARRGTREPAMARAAGRAVRAMHEAGVSHRDLNASNLLARADGATWRAWVIDLEGLLPRPVPEERRVAEVLRLCRSVDKWEASSLAGLEARRAFLSAALPGRAARRLLRRAAPRRSGA